MPWAELFFIVAVTVTGGAVLGLIYSILEDAWD